MALNNQMFKQYIGSLDDFKKYIEELEPTKFEEIEKSIVFIHPTPIAYNPSTNEIDNNAIFNGWIYANGYYYTCENVDASIKEAKTTLSDSSTDFIKIEKTVEADNHDNYDITLDIKQADEYTDEDKIAAVSYVDKKVGTAVQSVISVDSSLDNSSDDYIQIVTTTDTDKNTTINSKLQFATTDHKASYTATGIATDEYVQDCFAWGII